MPVVFSIYIVAASIAFFLVPGMLLVRLAARDKYADSFMAAGFAVGWGAVCFGALMVTGLLGLVTRFHMSLGLVAAVAGATAVACVVALRLREGGFAFFKELFIDIPRKRFSLAMFLFLGYVIAVYLLAYDSSCFDQERCVTRAGVLPYHDYLSANPPLGFPGCVECFTDRNAFLLWNGGQRQGPVVFVSTFMALFGFPGFRILHAFFGLVTAWFGWHLGRRMFGRLVPAYLTGIFLALNPYALSIPLLDENIMALALGTAMFYFLLESRTQWLFAGMFFGLLLGVRHLGVLSIPAVLYLALANNRSPHYTEPWVSQRLGAGRVANVVILTASTALFAAPCAITHLFGYWSGSGLFESFVSMAPVRHSFLGIEFSINGLVSWPFVDAPVRSPYNGFPTLVSFPLTIVQTWGILGMGSLCLGIVWAWSRRRMELASGVLWFLPQLALLCVMANWVEPNKMGVWLSYSQPLAVGVVAGIVALAGAVGTRLKSRLVSWVDYFAVSPGNGEPAPLRFSSAISIVVGASVVLVGTLLLARGYVAPVDERNYGARVGYIMEDYPITPPMVTASEESYARDDRARLTRLSFLPQFNLARPLMVLHLRKLRALQLVRDFGRPFFKDYCERPKDIMHGLSGIPIPPSHFPGHKGRPDDRKGDHATLADMMHHPVSSIRDEAGGRWGACYEGGPKSRDRAVVRVDLSSPPVDNAAFLARVGAVSPNDVAGPPTSGEQTSAQRTSVEVGSQVIVANDIPLSWAAPHPAHLALIPVREGYYFMILWFGKYRFDHLDDRPDVRKLSLSSPDSLELDLPEGSVIRFYEVTSVEPSRFHVWNALAVDGQVLLHGPVPSSY